MTCTKWASFSKRKNAFVPAEGWTVKNNWSQKESNIKRRKKTLFASHRKLMISDRERNWFEKEREKTVIDSSKYFKNTTLFTYLKASKLWRSNT